MSILYEIYALDLPKPVLDKIESVQRRAARYVAKRYHNTSSVTSMLNHLNWNTLENRRNINTEICCLGVMALDQ
jgi:hypothetical protein